MPHRKPDNVTPLRPDNSLLQECRTRLGRKMRGLGLFLIHTNTVPEFRRGSVTPIPFDPMTQNNLEQIRNRKQETLKRIKAHRITEDSTA